MYGPYLAVGKRNVRLPKDIDPAEITLEKCLELAGGDETATTKKAPAKKATTTKTPAKAAAKAPAKKAVAKKK